MDDMGGMDPQEYDEEKAEYAATIRRVKENGRVRVEAIPPDEFLLSDDCRNDINQARFVGHRRRMTISDLVDIIATII